MARMVHCKKLNRELEGLDAPPFPGPKGQEIYEHVSKQAWLEWLEHQTRLINEKHLNMMDMTARTYLNEQRDRFLSGQDIDQAEGYVPPAE
ncbi:oxidative damage protection protein [Porticoccus hydrocarbonoclasticus]|jgi:Fe-S cluster biosynthesis and repair protein YggX|uniref:oxidative damage protection protein n=1 Tax=Porticoccus hydrocarbonoclasticus TaxID=1073414 RepID=UPI002353CDD8|nr:oxidative damage protection protein [Porticoccus hydrocarbonoclasticus]|tara:strand:+ start:192 stop:464 length:273 start_codon:yes stop_codon:yes gene_type:complete